jgi:hypothetical protein
MLRWGQRVCLLSRVVLLAAPLAAAAVLGSCKSDVPATDTPTSAPASLPASSPARTDAWQQLLEYEERGLKQIGRRRHGPLLRIAEAMEELRFQNPDHALRRDALVKTFRAEAAIIKDALHRFLFVELRPLPEPERKQLLAAADRGDEDVLERSACALAEHLFESGQGHLRAMPPLRAGTTEPITRLPVRYAGRAKFHWKKEFDGAFNARMRGLALRSRPADPAEP